MKHREKGRKEIVFSHTHTHSLVTDAFPDVSSISHKLRESSLS